MDTDSREFRTFFDAYVKCALWSSTHDDVPLNANYARGDIHSITLGEMCSDCADFWESNHPLIKDAPEQAGHDFWLTRNRYGAGFWDGDWPEESERKLTDAAHAYGEYALYLDDDGMIRGC